jgi:CheY-like chemotaxis protein
LSVILYPAKSAPIQTVAEIFGAIPESGALYRASDVAHARRLAALCRPYLLVVEASDDPAVLELAVDFRTCYPVARILVLLPPDSPAGLACLLQMPQVSVLHLPLETKAAAEVIGELLRQGATPELATYRASLDQVTLLDVLQIKVFSAASTALMIIGGRGESGAILLERGSICHASSRRKSGLEAFYEILFWPGGSIEEAPLPEEVPRTITTDTPSLLLETAQRMDQRGVGPRLNETLLDTSPIRHDVNGRTVHLGDAAEEHLDQLVLLPKFLVVDDNPMILRYADDVLARHWPDHAVITVQTAAEALSCVLEFRPRLIVLDLVLPDGRGDGVARKLRDDPDHNTIPIIMISGRVEDLRDIARECPNVVATLAKPFTPNQLIETVRAAESFISA